MSFRLKTIVGIAMIEVVLLTILVFSSMRFLQESNEAQLMERAQTSAQLFATMTTDAVVSMDLATLEEMVSKSIANPGVHYLRVRHESGIVLSEMGNASLLAAPFQADRTVKDALDDQSFDVSWPIAVEGIAFGQIELGLDTASLEVFLQKARVHMMWVAGVEIVLVGIFGWILGSILTRRLTALQAGAQRVANGEVGHTIAVTGRDELAQTAQSFNEMSAALAAYATEVEGARERAETKLAQTENLLSQALESLSQGVMIVDEHDQVQFINQAFMKMYTFAETDMSQVTTGTAVAAHVKAQQNETDVQGDARRLLMNGRTIMPSVRFLSSGGYVLVDTDITTIIQSEEKARQLEVDLLQSQKMESIGRLAGGVAHEINTPVHFVGTNLQFIKEAAADIFDVVDAYEKLMSEVKSKNVSLEGLPACEAALAQADFDFVREELPQAVDQAIEGVERVAEIVASMKAFSHPTSSTKTAVNLNAVVERAVAICQSEWKPVAHLELDLADQLPTVMGSETELSQVVLNIIVNAAQAIGEHARTGHVGRIAISTDVHNGQVRLTLTDDGPGIPDTVKNQIFDPFFTTKEVGKGTGQGLAIVHDIVVNKHDAEISVTDGQEGGAVFQLVFPVPQAA